MSKNLTRKGLALGAVVALGSSLFAGAPAFAAEELVVAPALGTEWITPSDTNFAIQAYYASGVSSANAANLKLKVSAAGNFRVDQDSGTSFGAATDAVSTALLDGTTETSDVLSLAANNKFVGLAVNSAATTTTYTVNVQAFEDANNDGAITSGELTSKVQTITFIKYADVVWTPSIVTPVVTAAAATSKVTIKSNINLAQLDSSATGNEDSQVAVVFSEDTTTPGSYALIASTGVYGVAASYNATDNQLEATSAVSALAFAAGDKVKAQLYFSKTPYVAGAVDAANVGADNWDEAIAGRITAAGTGTVASPTSASALAAAKTVEAAVVTPSISALAQTAVVDSAVAVQDATATSKILTGTASFEVKTTATAATGFSKAGIAVTFTVAEQGNNTLDAAAKVSTGTAVATSFQNTSALTAQKYEVVAYTDADGIAKITVDTTGTKAGNQITVTSTSQGYTGALTTITVADRLAGALNSAYAIGSGYDQIAEVGKDVTLKISVKDQFGAAITATGFSVAATEGTTVVEAPVTSGVATIVLPKYTTAGSRTVSLQAKYNGVTTNQATGSLVVKVGTQTAVANIVYSAVATGTGVAFGAGTDADLGLNVKAFTAVDTRTRGVAPTLTAEYTTLTVNTYDAANAAVSADVTIAAKGLDFVAGGVYARDSITVRSNTSGVATVQVYSQVGGSKTLTITSGSVSKSQAIVHVAGAATAGAALTLNAAGAVKSGRSVTVTGLLADKFGNGVSAGSANNFKVTYVGPGFAVNVPTASDADGTFAFNVLYLNNETGVGTVTVKYDQNADGDYGDSTDLSASKTILVGVSATVRGSTATVKNALGGTIKVVRGSKVTTKVATSNTQKVTVKGRTGVVKVYVNGVKIK